jgi:hypothetical protein
MVLKKKLLCPECGKVIRISREDFALAEEEDVEEAS